MELDIQVLLGTYTELCCNIFLLPTRSWDIFLGFKTKLPTDLGYFLFAANIILVEIKFQDNNKRLTSAILLFPLPIQDCFPSAVRKVSVTIF